MIWWPARPACCASPRVRASTWRGSVELLPSTSTAVEASPGDYVVTTTDLTAAMGRVSTWCSELGVDTHQPAF